MREIIKSGILGSAIWISAKRGVNSTTTFSADISVFPGIAACLSGPLEAEGASHIPKLGAALLPLLLPSSEPRLPTCALNKFIRRIVGRQGLYTIHPTPRRCSEETP